MTEVAFFIVIYRMKTIQFQNKNVVMKEVSSPETAFLKSKRSNGSLDGSVTLVKFAI